MAVHITNRADVEALIREQVVSTIFQDAPKQSVFMSLGTQVAEYDKQPDPYPRAGFPA